MFITIGIAAYRQRKSRDRQRLRDRLERYRRATSDVDVWCGHEFPYARLIAEHIQAHGEGDNLNAGTPMGNEPCTVSGLREQLRRMRDAATLHRLALQRVSKLIDLDPGPDTPEGKELKLLGSWVEFHEEQILKAGN